MNGGTLLADGAELFQLKAASSFKAVLSSNWANWECAVASGAQHEWHVMLCVSWGAYSPPDFLGSSSLTNCLL